MFFIAALACVTGNSLSPVVLHSVSGHDHLNYAAKLIPV